MKGNNKKRYHMQIEREGVSKMEVLATRGKGAYIVKAGHALSPMDYKSSRNEKTVNKRRASLFIANNLEQTQKKRKGR